MPETAVKKDFWDRLTAISAILVPVSIAIAGHLFANGMKQAEINSQQKLHDQAMLQAYANTRVDQAALINSMMKSLMSKNLTERKLAVQAVLIALPEQGPELVRIVAQSDEDKSVKLAAQTSLQQRMGYLIRNLFSEDAGTRIRAAQDIVQGWRSEPNAVQSLLEYADKNRGNANGIYNTVVVLNDFSIQALEPHKEALFSFITMARTTGEKTAAKTKFLEKRLNG